MSGNELTTNVQEEFYEQTAVDVYITKCRTHQQTASLVYSMKLMKN